MKIYKNPTAEKWSSLSQRPIFNQVNLSDKVNSILNEVKNNGDTAVRNFTKTFDCTEVDSLRVSKEEIEKSLLQVPQELKDAIKTAYNNIYAFHKAQEVSEEIIETTPGVKCWRKALAIEKVGLYIPGGSAPLFSTILMLGIPAKIAGCKQVILCTPPNKNQEVDPTILYTANLVGIGEIYKIGGAQAIAAMSFGTETIPRVYKIFGPGNQYVTKAKELVQQQGVAIDVPAGPSEVLVIADNSCNPAFVAADLLSQAEHGEDSQVILLSDDENIINKCISEVYKQLEFLPRKEITAKALKNSKAIILKSIEECVDFSNQYAPEHLIIASEKASDYADAITNAGSVFLGNYSCEASGDYASGTNHTLPTNGFSKNYSGVSLESFQKKITFQKLNKEGIKNLGKTIEIMAEAEGLQAHKNAVSIRLKEIDNA